LDLILLTLLRYGALQPIGSRPSRSRIAAVVAFLDEHLANPLSLPEGWRGTLA